ncbi:hypothetical protein NKJ40_27690 [Mesorhizobium sp. M0119]|uniref:hypothetical protein n=1 Tax=Mesorhizobium sp. M0119 TaxID=2956885 RepID=UPI00333B880D
MTFKFACVQRPPTATTLSGSKHIGLKAFFAKWISQGLRLLVQEAGQMRLELENLETDFAASVPDTELPIVADTDKVRVLPVAQAQPEPAAQAGRSRAVLRMLPGLRRR